MSVIDIDPSGLGMVAKLLAKTLAPAIKVYRDERINDFFSAIDVAYDRLSPENKEELNKFSSKPESRKFLLERMESIISTDSNLAYWVHILLICKDYDTWESDSCEKAILRSIYQISDETLNMFLLLMECDIAENETAPLPIRTFNENSELYKLNNVSPSKVASTIEDLKTRSILVPEPVNNRFFGTESYGDWSFRYGITDEAIVLERLVRKAKELSAI